MNQTAQKDEFSLLVSKLRHKSILITGGSGFVGKNLCEFLLDLNRIHSAEIKVYVSSRRGSQILGAQNIIQDIVHPIQLEKKIDFVIHAATPVVDAGSDFHQLMGIIVNGTKNVLDFARHQKARVLLLSSGAVYGVNRQLRPVSENAGFGEPIYDSSSPYATGKRFAEWMAQAQYSDVEYSIARCFTFSGPYLPLDKHFAIGNFILDGLKSKTINIKGDGTAVRSYLDSGDMCRWMLTMLTEAAPGSVYNLGSDLAISIKDLAIAVQREFPQVEIQIENANAAKSGEALVRSYYVPDVSKAKKELGLEVTCDLKASLRKMIAFAKTSVV